MSRAKTPTEVRSSFSRASRFRVLRPSSAEFLAPQSSFHMSRSPSFGYGRRWEPHTETGKDAPPSTAYRIKSCFDLRIAGPTFRRPTRPMHRPEHQESISPGPGHYSSERSLGLEAPKITLKGKWPPARSSNTPPPGHYSPRWDLLSDQRFSRISFGIGSRNSPVCFAKPRIKPFPALRRKQYRAIDAYID